MRAWSLVIVVGLVGFGGSACTGGERGPSSPGLSVAVAPLELPGIGEVCYDLRVTNGPAGTGEVVWSRGTPGLNGGTPDAGALCSGRYGSAAGGDLSYVGTCDASGSGDADPAGERMNSVTLWFDALYDGEGAYLDPDGAAGWRNPCPAPAGCTLDVLCEENADARVTFDLTVMRDAEQGFFDVAVSFEDIFCSAKLDTCYADGRPIELLHGADEARDWTAVFAFACTAGGGPAETTLHYGEVTVLCEDGTSFLLDPGGRPGNLAATFGDDVLHYGVYRGVEALACDVASTPEVESCDKLYWNLALSLDDLGALATPCTLSFSATATDGGGGFVDGLPPGAGVAYPYIAVDAALTPATCQRHALDDGGAVSSVYRGAGLSAGGIAFAPSVMCSRFDGALVEPMPGADCRLVSRCAADEYQVSPPTATSDAVCAPLTVCGSAQYESAAPTATSDRVCSACTPITNCASGLTCTDATDSTCASCAPGWLGPQCDIVPDTATTAFTTAASISDPVQHACLDELVRGLKEASLWTRMKCIFPMVGGTAGTHSWNLRDPATCRLTFNGGWTHGPTGAQPNGVDGYATFSQNMRGDAEYAGGTTSANAHLSFYSRTQATAAVGQTMNEIGGYESGGIYFQLGTLSATGTASARFSYNALAAKANYTSAGFYVASATSNVASTFGVFKNGTLLTRTSNGATSLGLQWPSPSIYGLGAVMRNGSTAEGFSNREIGFASVGLGLTDTQVATLSGLVDDFQACLGGGRAYYQFDAEADAIMRAQDLTSYSLAVAMDQLAKTLAASGRSALLPDPDARLFILRTLQTTDAAQDAIQALVAGLKTEGLWNKLIALYPMVGGTAEQHKMNLRNPVDSNAAYRLTFNGGWNHSATGAKPNGVDAYAVTNLNPRTLGTNQASVHLGFFSRTSSTTLDNQWDIGASECWTAWALSAGRAASGTNNPPAWTRVGDTGQLTQASPTGTTGFFVSSRTSLSTGGFALYKDGAVTASGTSTHLNLPGTGGGVILSANNEFNGYGCTGGLRNFSDREVGLASMGAGLTAAEVGAYTTLVTAFQEALGRGL